MTLEKDLIKMDIKGIRGPKAYKLIDALKKLDGAFSYDGDASNQVVFKLKNGKILRIGCTDSDVGSGNLWIDQYNGLNDELKRSL